MAQAGANVLQLDEGLQAAQRKQREFGGPDDAFEIVTDPETGTRTVTPVPQFQEYLERKAIKPKDVADINGRAMYALQQLPAEQRAAAYAQMRQNPAFYGVDPSTMPESYDPNYAAVTSGMGMTVSQALTRQQAQSNAADMQEYRQHMLDDRDVRTGIYRDRSAAATAQGAERVAQGAERLSNSKAKGTGKSGGPDVRYEYKIGPDGRMMKRLKR